MDETPSTSSGRSSLQLGRRLLRLPSFRAAFIGSLAVLLAFVGWAFLDASFPAVFDPSLRSILWHDYPLRLLLFAVLAITGITNAVILLSRVFFADRRGRSLRNLLLVVALASMWIGLFASYSGLIEAGFRWRFRQIVPRLKEDASILLADWPTTDGELPSLGKFMINPRDSNVLYLTSDRQTLDMLPLNDRPIRIKKQDNARLLILFGPMPTWVEYRSDESQPNPARSAVELEPHWFLVRSF